jgi:hypothetical protein
MNDRVNAVLQPKEYCDPHARSHRKSMCTRPWENRKLGNLENGSDIAMRSDVDYSLIEKCTIFRKKKVIDDCDMHWQRQWGNCKNLGKLV